MEITKEIFEHYVPALTTPDTQLFNKLSAFIAATETRLADLDVSTYITTSALELRYAAHVCAAAAYEAVPHLDLVATPTGFGIVSNQNVAPASRERVDALREQLRREKCTSFEFLILALLSDTTWRDTAAAASMVTSLMFLPCHLRRHGVTLDGAPVYQEEFEKMATRIAKAERELEFLISPELYDHLVARQLAPASELTAEEKIAIDQACLYLATCLHAPDFHGNRAVGRRLLKTVRKAGFTEYLNSNTYAAQTFTPYQNEQPHPTFFFS